MISYFVTRAHTYTLSRYLWSRGWGLRDRLRIVPYESIPRMRELPAGACIFADLERLEPGPLAAAARLHDHLAREGAGRLRLLNRPGRTTRRYELLRLLRDRGLNSFDARRATERPPGPRRFPVFVRHENDHDGSLTPLLGSEAALEAALADLARRGHAPEGLLVVEFCDTAGADGLYRKLSVFVVGGELLPRHVFWSPKWVVKVADVCDAAKVAEERDFIERNPHAASLREVVEAAGVAYGRIDYGFRDGRPEIFEINTNPAIVNLRGKPGHEERARIHLAFAERFFAALEALDAGPAGPPVPLPASLDLAPLRTASGADPTHLGQRAVLLVKDLLGAWRYRRIQAREREKKEG